MTYSVYDNINYMYNLIPYNVSKNTTTAIEMFEMYEMYEIEKVEDWNIIKLI
jgi:hypothetical protein